MHMDLGELERELNRYLTWCRKNVVKRTQEGHLRGIRNWFKKAEEFRGERAGIPNGHGDNGNVLLAGGDSGAVVDDAGLVHKLAAYRAFLAKNPRQAQEYLERQPARVQAVLRGEGE
jgi:hypothetical protein